MRLRNLDGGTALLCRTLQLPHSPSYPFPARQDFLLSLPNLSQLSPTVGRFTGGSAEKAKRQRTWNSFPSSTFIQGHT